MKDNKVSRKEFLSAITKSLACCSLLGSVPSIARTEGSPSLVGHVISHTHWDRAWYYPFEHFRINMVKLMRKLLDLLDKDPSYKFLLDGQTIILEDFLEIYPGERERIKALVQNGQLAVGPFYVEPDQFLISGESLIRNLMIGIRQAKEFGPVQMEAYLADNFGHPAQLPQILQGFHIRSMLCSANRGMKEDELRKGWARRFVAPDGKSSVILYIMYTYCNFYYWGFDNFNPDKYPTHAPDMDSYTLELAEDKLKDAIAKYKKDGELNTRNLYLGNGIDHQEAQPHVPWLIEELNRSQNEIRLVHSSPKNLIDAVLAEGRKIPELSSPLGEDTLFGTMTSRVYLQTEYTRIAGIIEMVTEPLLSFVNVYGRGHRVFREPHHLGFAYNPGQNWPSFPQYPQGEMEYLWKLLLKNAPHDDICGCSVDAVHQDMENRFKRCSEVAGSLWNDALLVLAGRLLENEPDSVLPRLVIFNPHPFSFTDALTTTLDLEGINKPEELKIVDSAGRELPVAVMQSSPVEYPKFDGNEFNEKNPFIGLHAEFAFRPDLPPCSLSVYKIVRRELTGSSRGAPKNALPSAVEKDGTIEVENSFYTIRFHPDGTFDLYDKQLEKSFPGLGRLEDLGDAGNSYEFKPLEQPATEISSDTTRANLRITTHNDMYTEIEVCLELMLPVSLDELGKSRKEETTANPIKMVYRIPHHRKGGRLTVEIDNKSRDHHLLMWFPGTCRTDQYYYDCKFDFATYPVGYDKARLDSVAMAADGGMAFGIVLDSPTVLESRQGSGASGAELGWSLVRSVGWVSNGLWPADEAQCLRKITRRMEWYTGSEKTVRSCCLQRRRTIHISPPVLGVTPQENRQYVEKHYSDLPLETGSLLKITGEDVHLSCLKKAERNDGWIIRLYSLADHSAKCKLTTHLPVNEAFITDMNEQPSAKLIGSRTMGFNFELGAKEIKTLLLTADSNLIDRSLRKKS